MLHHDHVYRCKNAGSRQPHVDLAARRTPHTAQLLCAVLPHFYPRITPPAQLLPRFYPLFTPTVQFLPHFYPRITPPVQLLPRFYPRITPTVQFLPRFHPPHHLTFTPFLPRFYPFSKGKIPCLPQIYPSPSLFTPPSVLPNFIPGVKRAYFY